MGCQSPALYLKPIKYPSPSIPLLSPSSSHHFISKHNDLHLILLASSPNMPRTDPFTYIMPTRRPSAVVNDPTSPKSLAGRMRDLVTTPKAVVDIKLDREHRKFTYSTMDRIQGLVSITAPVDTKFDSIDINFLGNTISPRLSTKSLTMLRSNPHLCRKARCRGRSQRPHRSIPPIPQARPTHLSFFLPRTTYPAGRRNVRIPIHLQRPRTPPLGSLSSQGRKQQNKGYTPTTPTVIR